MILLSVWHRASFLTAVRWKIQHHRAEYSVTITSYSLGELLWLSAFSMNSFNAQLTVKKHGRIFQDRKNKVK